MFGIIADLNFYLHESSSWVGCQVFIDFLFLDVFNLIGLFSPTLVISRKFITVIKKCVPNFLGPTHF